MNTNAIDNSSMYDFAQELDAESAATERSLVCNVCGDEALGYNFGAIVCESCKSFYRRHVHRQSKFVCAASGTCLLNYQTRRHCPACRLERCFAVGMRRPPTGAHQSTYTAQKVDTHRRYKVLVTRLKQRLKRTSFSKAGCLSQPILIDDDEPVLCQPANPAYALAVDEYEDMYERISAASEAMLHLANRGYRQVQPASLSWNDGMINLAMSGYIQALQHFNEVKRLDGTATRLILGEQMLDQVNLYSMFTVNYDTTGWYAVDAFGSASEQSFADFVQCLSGDGVEAQYYVELFLTCVRSFRASFEHDWPVVLVVFTLVNLFSPKHAAQQYLLVDALRRRFEDFLVQYLRRNYADRYARFFEYCTQQFPSMLQHLVLVQRRMFSQLRPSRGTNATKSLSAFAPVDNQAASRLDVLLKPLVFYISERLSGCSSPPLNTVPS